MRRLKTTKRFERDLKRTKKSGSQCRGSQYGQPRLRQRIPRAPARTMLRQVALVGEHFDVVFDRFATRPGCPRIPLVIFSDDVLSAVSKYLFFPIQLRDAMFPSIYPSIFIQLLRQCFSPRRLTEKAELLPQ